MSRWRAGLIHLGISAVIAIAVFALIFGVWYPPPYFSVSRAELLLVLIIGVDLVLGPLLTLIVFDQRKRWLALDLTVIALLQVGALAYGMTTLFLSRPAFLVAERDRITMIYAHSVREDAKSGDPYQRVPKWGPELVALRVPDDRESISQAVELMVRGGGELRERMAAYAPFLQIQEQMLAHARPASELTRAGTLEGQSVESLRYVPVYCRAGVVYMLLDAGTGEPLGATAANVEE